MTCRELYLKDPIYPYLLMTLNAFQLSSMPEIRIDYRRILMPCMIGQLSRAWSLMLKNVRF